MSIDEIKLKFNKLGKSVFLLALLLSLSIYGLIQLWLGPQVSGYAVAKGELKQTLVANGRVISSARFEVASKAGGKVLSIPVTEGQSVRTGQTLIVLENKDEKAALALAKLAVVLANARLQKIKELTQSGSEQSSIKFQATLDKARTHYGRIRELSAKGYVSQDQLGDALRNLAIAQSQLATAQFQAKANRGNGSDYANAELALNQARATEKVAREKLGNTLIKSEADGVLLSKNIATGDLVSPGVSLMVISSGSNTQLRVTVEEKDMRFLQRGQHALVVADGYPGQQFEAELSNADSAEIKFDVAAPPDFLQQDMLVSVTIEVARHVAKF
jgi:HlyD family secretion protein